MFPSWGLTHLSGIGDFGAAAVVAVKLPLVEGALDAVALHLGGGGCSEVGAEVRAVGIRYEGLPRGLAAEHGKVLAQGLHVFRLASRKLQCEQNILVSQSYKLYESSMLLFLPERSQRGRTTRWGMVAAFCPGFCSCAFC